MSRRLMWLVVLATISLCIAATALANGPEVGIEGGAVFPIESRDVQLVSEEVTLDMRDAGMDLATARCVYHLRNLSAAPVSLHMGFVLNAPIDPGSPESWAEMYRSADLRVKQDGRSRPVSFRPQREGEFRERYGVPADSIPSWPIDIAPRGTSTVEVDYHVRWGGGCEGSNCYRIMHYYTRPAAMWARRIEHARFELILGDAPTIGRLRRPEWRSAFNIAPPSHQWTDRGLAWEFWNWEPNDDLSFDIGLDDADPSRDPLAPDSVAAMQALTEGLDEPVVVVDSIACRDPRTGSHPEGGWPEQHVRVRVHVDEAGHVVGWRLPDPPAPFEEESRSCTRRWRFTPPRRGGQPVDAWVDVVVVWPARR